MRMLLLSVGFLALAILSSCTKDTLAEGKDVFLVTSETALHFDTVFTSAGSVTRVLKVFNINSGRLRLSNIQLGGGVSSPFRINVSGSPGTQFSNIEIGKGDSLYIFVSVTITPDSRSLPFLMEDSLRFDFNGNTQFVGLDAFGQNARFLRASVISKDTTWQAGLPYVLLDTFAVSAGATLTLEKGVQVYCHANTPLTIAGTLLANGTADSAGSIRFANDRLDAPYKDQPGTWQGIYFAPGSHNNKLTGVVIKNALQGIAADDGSSVSLDGCRVENCAGEGIIASHSTVSAVNCLITNSSYNLYLFAGGQYSFTNCTVAAYTTRYLYHRYPVLTLSNSDDEKGEARDLQALFRNCILFGEAESGINDIQTIKSASAGFSAAFENTVYSSVSQDPLISYNEACLPGADPLFLNIDRENGWFDFHLSAFSPCINAGKKPAPEIDIDGILRTGNPDIGCYEFPE